MLNYKNKDDNKLFHTNLPQLILCFQTILLQMRLNQVKSSAGQLESFYYLKKQGKRMNSILSNGQLQTVKVLAHLTIRFNPNTYFYLGMQAISLLQTLTTILHPETLLFKSIAWTQPCTYLPPIAPLTMGAIASTILLLLLSLIWFSKIEYKGVLCKPGICLQYIGNISIYVMVLLKTIFLVPLFRAAFLILEKQQSSSQIAFAIILLTIYIVIYPLILYISSNASIFTSPISNQINRFNSELLYCLSQPFLAIASVYHSIATITLLVLFLILYLYTTIKTPICSYRFQTFKKALTSIFAMVCLSRIFNEILGDYSGNLFVELIGILCFIGIIQVYSTFRLKRVLSQQEPSVYQIKLLAFMIGELQTHFQHLAYFIIHHRNNCNDPCCRCKPLMEHLSSKGANLRSQALWYQFLVNFCRSRFDLTQIKKLGKTEMTSKIEQYSNIVFQVVQIYLFKLNKFNTSWLILSQYRTYLESSGLGHLWSSFQSLIIKYHLQSKLEQTFKDKQRVNVKANIFLNIQIEFTRYNQLLLKTSDQVKCFWSQLAKPQPDQALLREAAKQYYKSNHKIKKLYGSLAKAFPQASNILKPITDEYCRLILNLSANSALHVIEKGQFQRAQHNMPKGQRLDENMRCFSEDSTTPVCLVSLDPQDFGKISNYNIFFQREMEKNLGEVTFIWDLIIPEMRDDHLRSMKAFLHEDTLQLSHKHKFIYGKLKHIVSAHTFIQIMPSIGQGLRSAIFLKSVKAESKLFITINGSQVVYKSQSFQSYIKENQNESLILSKCSQDREDSEMEEQSANKFILACLSRFLVGNIQYKCFELKNQESQQYDNFKHRILNEKLQQKTQNKKLSNINRNSSIRRNRKQTTQEASKSLVRKEESQQFQRTYEREQKVQKNITNAFKIFSSKEVGKKVKRIICLINTIAILLLIGLFAITLAIKKQENQFYQQLSENNENFSNLMVNIIKTATWLKQINLLLYQNKDPTRTYEQLLAAPNIALQLDSVVSFFDFDQISQTWPSLRLKVDKTFQQSQGKYVNTMRDFLQTPLINLQNTNLQNFNFSFSLSDLEPPLTSTQIFLHNFETNALYFTIPKLRDLKQKVMSPIYSREMSIPKQLILIYLLITVVTILTPLLIICINRRIQSLTNDTYRFIELLTPDLIKKKLEETDQFLRKYSPNLHQSQLAQKTTPLLHHEQPFAGQMSRNLSRAFDELTDRQLHLGISLRPQQQTIDKLPSHPIQTNTAVIKRRKDIIFHAESPVWMVIKYLLPSLPFYIFTIVFLILEKQYLQNVRYMLLSQYVSNAFHQYLILVNLYLLHLGIYDHSLEPYFSIPQYLVAKIYTIFAYINSILSASNNLIQTDKTINTMINGNICQLQQQGFFSVSKYSFQGRGNYTRCVELANNILTKGLTASMLSYVEGVNNLFLANLNISSQGTKQQLDFFNSQFFTGRGLLLDYFDMSQSIFKKAIGQGFSGLIANSYNQLSYTVITFIILLSIFLVFLPKYLTNKMEKKMIQVSALFCLISQTTVIQNPSIKDPFINKIDQFNVLK